MKKKKKIKIVDCSPYCWYDDYVGEVYKVKDLDNRSYVILDGQTQAGYLIAKHHCKIIEDDSTRTTIDVV